MTPTTQQEAFDAYAESNLTEGWILAPRPATPEQTATAFTEIRTAIDTATPDPQQLDLL